MSETLDQLQAENFLSDRRFTEQFVHQRTQRGQGPVRIRHELYERGVSVDLVAQFVDADHRQWCRRAQEVRRKRFGSTAPASYEERTCQARFLQHRGFDIEHVHYALETRGLEHEEQ